MPVAGISGDLTRHRYRSRTNPAFRPQPAGTVTATRQGSSSRGRRVDNVLSSIPLVGWGPIIAIAAIAVIFLVLAVVTWRNHKVWRWVFVALFVIVGLGAVGDWVNTQFARFDTAADLFGIPNYPTVDG